MPTTMVPDAVTTEDLGKLTLKATEAWEALRRAELLVEQRRAEFKAATRERNRASAKAYREGA